MISKLFQIVLYYFFYPIAKLVFKIEIKEIENLNKIDPSKKLIIAANHTHFLDSTIGAWAFTKYLRSLKYPFSKILPIRFIAGAEYFDFLKSPPFFPISLIVASYVRLNGSIPVLRGSNDNLENKLKNAVNVLNRNGKIFIFPEGKMSKDGNLQKGKRGIGYLHKVTKAPIIPMALINVHQCTKIKNLLLFILGKKRIKIYIGEPIMDISNLEVEEISNKVMEEIKKLIEKTGN
jgi:1-acyl-sn-glycerol-3-phosphate acyltransferase